MLAPEPHAALERAADAAPACEVETVARNAACTVDGVAATALIAVAADGQPAPTRCPQAAADFIAEMVKAPAQGMVWLTRLTDLVEAPTFDPNQTDEKGVPLLHRLLQTDMSVHAHQALLTLLKRGASPNSRNVAGVSALELFLPSGTGLSRWSDSAHASFKALLDAGANPNIILTGTGPNAQYETLLGRALQHKVLPAVKELLAHGADPNARHHDSPPILLASRSGFMHLQYTSLLIAAGADVRRTKLDGETRSSALEYAVRDRRTDLVKLLLQHGANPRRQVGKARLTALHMAVRRGDARMTQAILATGASPHVTDRAGRTPLHLCASGRFRGCVESMRLLLDAGGDLAARDVNQATPLLALAQVTLRLSWQADLLQLMLAHGDDPSVEDARHATALRLLVSKRGSTAAEKGVFLRATSTLLAADPELALDSDLMSTVYDQLPPGTERTLSALRTYRMDKCEKLL